jgi:ABC-type uncharacterized transport system substrate-binding protein
LLHRQVGWLFALENMRRVSADRAICFSKVHRRAHVDHFADLTRHVVRRHPDLIFTPGSRLALKFKESTTTIPTVGIMVDPVGVGIVPNLARPGGNITGVTVDAGVETMSKRLEFLKEVSPAISKVGVLCSRVSFENSVLGTLE